MDDHGGENPEQNAVNSPGNDEEARRWRQLVIIQVITQSMITLMKSYEEWLRWRAAVTFRADCCDDRPTHFSL
jgi:hypothetical protein